MALETLLAYRAIRRFAAVHIQQQTLLDVAQVDDTQMVGCQLEIHSAARDLWTQITSWEADTNPYTSTASWVWEEIAQPESSSRHRQAVWWSDLVVALVLKAILRHIPIDPAVSTQALQAAQTLRSQAGEGTLDLMLLNASHGVLILADTVLSQPEIQAQCRHFQVIIVVSRGKHFITYYRRTQLLADPSEEDGRLWLQELRVKRPLVEAERREESAGTTRSISQPTPHLVSYTTINNVKVAILSNSPDQQQYKDPKAAWRRIFRQADHAKEDSAADSTTALAKDTVNNTSSRKRGRPPGSNKSQCSKPKAIRGVKARRLEPVMIEEQSKPVSHVHGTANIDNNDNHSHTNNNDNTIINTNECNHHYTISNLNASAKYTPHNYNQTNSNTNNTCDSPSNISQTALVYAYGRNNTSNNNINTHNTSRQNNDNQYNTNNNTNINNISQLDPDSSDRTTNKVTKHVHPSYSNNCHYSSNL